MYKHGFTTSEKFLEDFVNVLITPPAGESTTGWTLVYPESPDPILERAVLKVDTTFESKWIEPEKYSGAQLVQTGSPQALHVTLTNSGRVVENGSVRVVVKDPATSKKTNLYFNPSVAIYAEPEPFEFFVLPGDRTTLVFNDILNGKDFYISYEADLALEPAIEKTETYYVSLRKPFKINQTITDNHYHVDWCIGTDFEVANATESLVYSGFPEDHYSVPNKLSWFKHQALATEIAKSWMPIEYWISFDNNGAAGVVMGDPGLSVDDVYGYLSSPFYFGKVDQIDGALYTDTRGNFAGTAGSYYVPATDIKKYGDYTGNGSTDVIMAYSKSGRPYNMHKISVFGAYEFQEKTFSSQSAHTGKHAVSDIVVGDMHENDRGKLRRCLAVPKIGKDHGAELIYNRYISGEEKTFIFLKINAPYTMFSTGSDVTLGFAILMD